MKCIRVNQWGQSEVVVIEDIDTPQPEPNEVLVRVKAVAINPLDWKIREGYLHEYVSLPVTLGSDLSGDIVELGEEVEGFELGTPIYGMKGFRCGSFAEYTTIRPSEMARKPVTLSYEEAAAVPHAALTAWQALVLEADLKPGQRVLIHAAAGGVGHFAVQFAKLKGAYVIGTASGRNEEFVRRLGADEFVNYEATSFETAVKDVDVVLDTIGFDTSTRSIQVIKPGGLLIGIVTPAPANIAAEHQVQLKFFGAHADSKHLAEIATLIDAGQVKPHVSQVLTLDQAREALQQSQTGHVKGKLIMTVDAG
jgi:NADPH:quinone reductase-like Zn-dependent oxidoreductase